MVLGTRGDRQVVCRIATTTDFSDQGEMVAS